MRRSIPSAPRGGQDHDAVAFCRLKIGAVAAEVDHIQIEPYVHHLRGTVGGHSQKADDIDVTAIAPNNDCRLAAVDGSDIANPLRRLFSKMGYAHCPSALVQFETELF